MRKNINLVKKILPQGVLKDLNSIKKMDPETIQEAKQKLYGIMNTSYGYHMSQDVRFYEREVQIRNHLGKICGYYDDDYSAAEYLLLRCDEKQPRGLILTEFSRDDYNFLKKENFMYQSPPEIEPISEEKLLARQIMLKYFQNDFKMSLRFYKDFGDYTIAEMDTINLTLAYWACYRDDAKLFFGAPQKLLILEDLATTLELRELRNIFNETVKHFVEFSQDGLFEPSLNVIEFYINFRDVAKTKFAKILYGKKCMYSAAVARKILTLYSHNLIAVDNDLVFDIFRHCIDEENPDFTKIYRNEEFYKSLEEVDPSEENLKIFLEKLVILNHLMNREFRNYIDSNVNPLKGLFNGKFDQFEDSYVINLYMKINSYYAKILENLLYTDAKRFEDLEDFGRFYLKTYNEEIKQVENEKNYTFLVDKAKKLKEIEFCFKLLFTQIYLNLKKREKEGRENINQIKIELQKLFQGVRTKQNFQIYNELLVEANSQLGLLKLPKDYVKNFTETIKTVSYNELKEFIGEDPLTKFENAQIALNNQIKGIDPAIIKEGWEPIFTPSKAKPQNILDVPNKLLGEMLNSLSPASRKEIFERNLLKDNVKLLEFANSEFENSRTDDGKSEEVSQLLVFGKGTDQEKQIMYNDLKHKSIEELKSMGFEELSSLEMKVDEEGNLRTNNNLPPELAKKLEEEFKLSEQVTDETTEIVDDMRKERDINLELKALAETVAEQDDKKVKAIMKALETGEEYSDPLYYTLIVEKDEWMRNRINYLKRHFSGASQVDLKTIEDITWEKHLELAIKYDQDSMEDKDLFKFMSPEEKRYTKLLAMDYEKGQREASAGKFEEAKLVESEDEEEVLDFRNYISDKIQELKRDDVGKKKFDFRRGKEIKGKAEDEDDDTVEYNYNPGSSRKRVSNKLRKL